MSLTLRQIMIKCAINFIKLNVIYLVVPLFFMSVLKFIKSKSRITREFRKE